VPLNQIVAAKMVSSSPTTSFDYNFNAQWSHFNDIKMHCILLLLLPSYCCYCWEE